jgi:osmotically-inducible protein OsmY
LSNAEAQEQIQHKLVTEPLLANADVGATVDDNSVVLSGTVGSEQEHELALRIAESYAGDRKIVDKLQIGQRT